MRKIIKFILILLIVMFSLLTVLSLIERSGTETLTDTEKTVLDSADRVLIRIKSALGNAGDDAENVWIRFKGFIGGWKVSPSEAKEKIEQGMRCSLLDVRSKDQYDKSHIPDAVSLPLPELEDKAEELIGSENLLVFVYGSSKNESKEAVRLLRSLGYPNALDLGSIEDWPYKLLIG